MRFDRLVKLPLYARHGIPEVWIIDLAAGVVEVHRGPTESGYAEATTLGRGAALQPLPGTTLAVADILG
ncbi:MAG: Uma2 family endonuclease [Paracraurococcus sp.]